MRSRQGAVLETLRRAQTFLGANKALLEPVIKSTGESLDDVLARLAQHAVSQDGGARAGRGETAKQRALRATLRFTHMRPIAEIAKLKLRDVPEFHALTMPPFNATAPRLIAAAGAMADGAKPHTEVFVGSGLPADFVEKLLAASEAVSQSLAGRDSHQGKRSGATAGLIAEEKRGRVVLKVLDSLVTPLLGSDDQRLAEWKAAKQVRRKTGPVAGTVVPASEPVTSPSVVVAPAVHPVVAPAPTDSAA